MAEIVKTATVTGASSSQFFASLQSLFQSIFLLILWYASLYLCDSIVTSPFNVISRTLMAYFTGGSYVAKAKANNHIHCAGLAGAYNLEHTFLRESLYSIIGDSGSVANPRCYNHQIDRWYTVVCVYHKAPAAYDAYFQRYSFQ
jgi:hypothetical protein